MNSFRIIVEEKHKYKKDSLFVLMFRDGENFGIDVTNSTSSFGRVIIDNKDDANYLFSLLNDYIEEQDGYLNACVYVNSILSYETYEKIILSLHTHGRNIEKMEAYAIIKMLGLIREDKKSITGMHIIKIFKTGAQEAMGEFISISDTGKYMFHFF